MLPSGLRDILEMIEERIIFGKPIVKVIVYLLPVAIIALIAAAIITGAKLVQSVLPNAPQIHISLREAVSFGVTLAAFAIAAVWIQRRLKQLEVAAANEDLRERLDAIETVLRENVEARLSKLATQAEFIDVVAIPSFNGQIKDLSGRVEYVESQVGSELFNVLLEKALNTQGLTLGKIQRAVEQLPVPEQLTEAEEVRIAHARELLHEAAKTARDVQPAGGDMDKATNQAWLHSKTLQLISDGFQPHVYRQFRNFQEGRDAKMKQHGEKPDGKAALAAYADYFEDLANRLTLEDLDTKMDLPASFAKFLKG